MSENAMPARDSVLAPVAGVIVGTIGYLSRQRLVVSLVALLVVLVLGASYLMFGSLQVNPLHSTYRVRVLLKDSGGLLADRDVTVRGVRVGRVSSVDLGDGGVTAVATIDGDVRIPADSDARVIGLSAAGEQYLDFVPTTATGPYLADGAVIGTDRTTTPVTLAQLLGDLNGTIEQLDPNKLHAIVQELGVSSAGPEKLTAIVNGGVFLIDTLGGVLPQTTDLLRNSRVVLGTVRDLAPGLRATAAELDRTLTGVEKMSGGYTTLVGLTPPMLQTMDRIIAENSPTMVQLLGSLTTIAQMSYVHIPALSEVFFPTQRNGSTADRVADAFHDGYAWALASIYPRKQCDYDTPRLPMSVPNFPEPYLYADCRDPDPTLLPRGARNAPRPPGDDTLNPPPGADPLATSDPAPVERQSIPLPYGGPYVPR
ncbi:MlaD family protein [Nocardia sp. alder85J]|uniref:MlaD family protein n=1 Tax=Nocardia sp. alder85J TaxID=2862949 RepID=UPI001CD4B12E|nr:MlaD family protein [Nocardia sp. alder85J]MCX4095208.1 MlaD family protein [Nocardia sp. alder85J]